MEEEGHLEYYLIFFLLHFALLLKVFVITMNFLPSILNEIVHNEIYLLAF